MSRRATLAGTSTFERHYGSRLSAHLTDRRPWDDSRADALAGRARNLGIDSRELARIHARALAAIARRRGVAGELPGAESERAGSFLARTAQSLAASGPATTQEQGPPAQPVAATDARPRAGKRERRLSKRLGAEVKRRKAAIADARRANAIFDARSQRMEERLRRLSRQLLHAQEEERARISRDLHDAIGQALAEINIGLATVRNEAQSGSGDLGECVAKTQELVTRSMTTVQEFARSLRPAALDELGLVPALRSHARTFAERSGIRLRFAADFEKAGLPSEQAIVLFRVAQEALVNVSRHSRARSVSVTLRQMRRRVRLEVRDDGVSFDVERVGRSGKTLHLGILGMQERVDMVGGRFAIRSARGSGTTVRAEVPLKAAAHG